MKTWSCFLRRRLTSCILAAGFASVPVSAQTFVSPGLGASIAPASRRVAGQPAPPGFFSGIASALDNDLPLYRAGPIALRPHLTYQAMRSTGIDIGNLRTIDTTTQTAAPGLRIEAGTHWQADYTGAWTYYSAREFKDSLDQTARLWGEYDFRSWRLGVSGEYASTYPIMVEFARQTHDISYATDAHATLFLTDRTEIELTGTYRNRRAHPLQPNPDWLSPDTRSWSSTDMLQWKYSERLKIGAGATFSVSDASIGASMTSIRPMVRATWLPTDKITAGVDAGYERHRFRNTNAQSLTNPFYSASLRYAPLKATMLMASLSRGVSASQLADIVTEVSGWQLGIQQRLLERFFFSASYGRQNTDYREARSNLPVSRGDRYETSEARLGMPLWARGTLSLFFRQMNNESSHKFYSFDTRQYGVEVSLTF